MSHIRLLVGLGNPGPSYVETRHNAGQWFIEAIAHDFSIPLKPEKKFFGLTGKGVVHGQEVHLLIPTTFMNKSGQSIAACANFFKIPPKDILIAHDELDIDPGTIRLKQGGGHGGHNGLRDTIARLAGHKDFHRLRIGIGHPGNARDVSKYVLKKAPKADQDKMHHVIDEAIRYLPEILSLDHQKAMNHLHSLKG
ncbi:MAG: aminoacyl-tRNA hydrolase [Cellvibrionales bacterium]|nr:aminoacyl-tRNA hydrolase [Cellvibrionales bacterium]